MDNLWTVTAEMEKENKMSEIITPSEPLKTKNDLTTRQWRLYDLLIQHSLKNLTKLTHKEMLEALYFLYDYYEDMDEHPDTPFNNLTSRRQLSDDLDAIVKSPNVHYVYVGGRFAVSQTEIDIYLMKKEIHIKKQWAKLYIQKAKAAHDNQMKIKFNQEKETYEAYVRLKENEVINLEEQLKAEYERI